MNRRQYNSRASESFTLTHTLRNQKTISQTAVVEGFGFWSGHDVRVEFRPAEIDTGIVFVRRDMGPEARIPAIVENRIETPLRTTLSAGGARVEMIEHVMAALAGLQIDNCEVWVDQPEMPGCDGSSLLFVEALTSAGMVDQDANRPLLIVRDVTRVGDDDRWIEARPSDSPGLKAKFRIEYAENPAIGRQTLIMDITPDSFLRELAPSRTFLMKEEAEWLQSQGLATRATCKDALVFDAEGPIENETRFENECVRHKMLDLVGDLGLAGCDLSGQIIAQCSGHRHNAELVRALLAEGEMLESWRRCA